MTARRVRVCALILAVTTVCVVDAQNSARLRFTRGRPQYPRDGWWMRVDKSRTSATSIQFTFGTDPKDLNGQDSWTPSDPAEMGLPDPLRTARHVYLNMTTTPASATAAVCVFFQEEGTEHIEFTGGKKVTLSLPGGLTASCSP